MTLALLGWVAKLVTGFGQWMLAALVGFANLLILAVGGALGALISLLPEMPGQKPGPIAEWVGWLNYYAPVAELVAGLVVWVGLWSLFLLVRIPLRWLKAL